jgi:hypothetical protein
MTAEAFRAGQHAMPKKSSAKGDANRSLILLMILASPEGAGKG